MTASEYFEKLIDLAFQQAKKKLDDYGSDGRKILLQDMENNPDIHHGILQQRLLEILTSKFSPAQAGFSGYILINIGELAKKVRIKLLNAFRAKLVTA